MRTRSLGAASFILGAALAIVAVFGCNNSKSPTYPNNPPPTSSHHHAVAIQGFAFSPSSLTIAVGDTVVWTNDDSAAHTVTSDSGSELNGSVGHGESYQHIFAAAGSYPYHCTVHPSMHGSVTVQQ